MSYFVNSSDLQNAPRDQEHGTSKSSSPYNIHLIFVGVQPSRSKLASLGIGSALHLHLQKGEKGKQACEEYAVRLAATSPIELSHSLALWGTLTHRSRYDRKLTM